MNLLISIILAVLNVGVLSSMGHGLASQGKPEGIEGTWELVSSIYDGKSRRPEDKQIWTLTKTHIVYMGGVKEAYTIDIKAKPTAIDITEAEGKKLLGIYETKGDTLRICVAPAEKGRPSAFESKTGTGQNLHTFKRTQTGTK